MPALFSLGMHEALEATQRELNEGERVFAYLDDVYVVARPERTRATFVIVSGHLSTLVGINVNMGKCRC